MRAAAPARARTWRTRNARTRLRAAVHMLPCSPAPAETSASRRFAPQVCRRSEIQRIASISHCCLPPSCAAGSSAPLRVNRSAVLLCTWRAHTAFSQSVLTRRAATPARVNRLENISGDASKNVQKFPLPPSSCTTLAAGGYLDILRCPSVAGPHLATLSHTPLPDHCRLARRPPPTCSGCSCLSL